MKKRFNLMPKVSMRQGAGGLIGAILGLLLATSCSVMPKAVNETAMAPLPFDTLVADAGHHLGETVILGGYVVDVKNEPTQSRLTAVEAPLGIGQEPKSKDLSKGRLILEYKGFLDPEVYTKDRKITVAGTLQGSSSTDDGAFSFPYVRIAVQSLHLWPVERPVPRDPYWDPWYPPWGWRYPYWW